MPVLTDDAWIPGKKFRMENLESDRIEEEMAFDAGQIAADLGIYATKMIA
jgi:hypothetical protein